MPQRFLDRLPALNADDWWDHYETSAYAWDLNYEVMGRVDKRTIVATARGNLDAVRKWAKNKEREPARPYDFDRDPMGVVHWEYAANSFTATNPVELEPPEDAVALDAVIEQIIEQYRLFIEDQRGWYLLWDKTAEKPELAAQLTFFGLARNYCKANNIVIDREVELGRRPWTSSFPMATCTERTSKSRSCTTAGFGTDSTLSSPRALASDR